VHNVCYIGDVFKQPGIRGRSLSYCLNALSTMASDIHCTAFMCGSFRAIIDLESIIRPISHRREKHFRSASQLGLHGGCSAAANFKSKAWGQLADWRRFATCRWWLLIDITCLACLLTYIANTGAKVIIIMLQQTSTVQVIPTCGRKQGYSFCMFVGGVAWRRTGSCLLP